MDVSDHFIFSSYLQEGGEARGVGGGGRGSILIETKGRYPRRRRGRGKAPGGRLWGAGGLQNVFVGGAENPTL